MAEIKVTFDKDFNVNIEADVSDAELPNLVNAVLCTADLVATVSHKSIDEILALTCSLHTFEKAHGGGEKTLIVLPHTERDKPYD